MKFRVEIEVDDRLDEYDQNSEVAQILENLAWALGVDLVRDVAVTDTSGGRCGRALFMTQDPKAVMAQVLAQHGEFYDNEDDDWSGCDCGWHDGTVEHNRGYTEHVAGVLAEALANIK